MQYVGFLDIQKTNNMWFAPWFLKHCTKLRAQHWDGLNVSQAASNYGSFTHFFKQTLEQSSIFFLNARPLPEFFSASLCWTGKRRVLQDTQKSWDEKKNVPNSLKDLLVWPFLSTKPFQNKSTLIPCHRQETWGVNLHFFFIWRNCGKNRDKKKAD